MEAAIGNTSSAAPTAKILKLPDRAAQGVPEGLELVRAAYEAAGGSCARPVEMRPLARRLGLEPRAVEQLAMRLQAERLVRVVSMANGLLRVTPEGARVAESEAPGPAARTDTPRVGGGLDGTRAATASPVVGRDALRELGELLRPLKAGLDRLDLSGALDGEQRSELAAEIRTIEAQSGSPRPKRRILMAALESVVDTVGSAASAAGGAGSGAESERILRAIDAFLGGNGWAGQTGQAGAGVGGDAGEAAGKTRAGRAARGARNGAGRAWPGSDPADDEDGSGTRRPEEGSAATVRTREAGGVRVLKRVRNRARDDVGRTTEQARGLGRPAGEGADEAVVEAGKGAGSAVEDVGAGGDQAVRAAAGAAGRVGDAADRTTIEEAEAGRRVLRAGDVILTTLNGDGEILDEELVGSVLGLPVEGCREDGGRVASRAEEGSGSPIRPRLGEDGGVLEPRAPPPATAGKTAEGPGHGPRSGPRPQEAQRRTEDRGAGDLPGRYRRQDVDGSRYYRGNSLGRIGGRRAPAVSPTSDADRDTLRSATAAGERKPNKKRPVSDGESGTKNRKAKTQEYKREKVSEGTQQQTQEDQYLQEAQNFFAQSMGRIKGRMQSDSAQLESIMQQLPEESQAQIQEMADSYAQFEGAMDQAAQDSGVQEAMDEAAQQARQNADEAAGKEPADQAADQAQEMAGDVGEQAQDAAGQVADQAGQVADQAGQVAGQAQDAAGEAADQVQEAVGDLADSLPEGYEALGQPFTDQQGNTVLQGQDEEGNTAIVQRVEDEEGNVVDSIYDQQGNLMDEVVPEAG